MRTPSPKLRANRTPKPPSVSSPSTAVSGTPTAPASAPMPLIPPTLVAAPIASVYPDPYYSALEPLMRVHRMTDAAGEQWYKSDPDVVAEALAAEDLFFELEDALVQLSRHYVGAKFSRVRDDSPIAAGGRLSHRLYGLAHRLGKHGIGGIEAAKLRHVSELLRKASDEMWDVATARTDEFRTSYAGSRKLDTEILAKRQASPSAAQ